MGKKGGGKVQLTDYYMSMHQGICAGPVDELKGIYIGEKTFWEDTLGSVVTSFSVTRNDLFGGNKAEGGAAGVVTWLPGNSDQVMPEALANKLGGTATTVPGFRGVASLFFSGSAAITNTSIGGIIVGLLTGRGVSRGFYWSSNTPYLKTLWAKVRRSPKGLNAAYRMIGNRVTASINGNTVTCNGQTATLTPGSVSIVGGHSFAITYPSAVTGERTVTFDGTPIVVERKTDEDDDYYWSVSIGSDERRLRRWGNTVNIMGVELTVGRTSMSIASGSATDAPDANPAHIIYECLTNTDWGMGGTGINVASFEDAGKTLFNEGLGLSLAWYSSDTIENFVSEILDHILATIFVNPSDGLLTIKLIRDDYDPATLPILNPDNCTVTSFDRKLWGETTNEVIVTWTNPVNEKEETVTVQDLANASIQGAVVSDNRNYYGVRNAALALQLATRDLRSASSPLASFQIEVDRTAFNFVPGGVAKLVYPEDGIDGVVLRINRIDYGKPGSPTITLACTEDVFGQPTAAYTVVEQEKWVDESVPPMVMPYMQFLTAPLYFAENVIDIGEAEYPDALTMVLAAAASNDVSGYQLYTITPAPNGQPTSTDLGHRSITGRATLASSISADYKTTIDSSTLASYIGPLYTYTNCFVVIGNGGDTGTEIALVSESSPTGIVLQRGLLDTVPRNWPVGTSMWFFGTDTLLTDNTVRADGEQPQYKLLTETSLGRLDFTAAPILTATLTDRAWRPNRPANVKVGGVAFGNVQMGSAASIPVTWANRNRLMEPTEVVKWYDGNVTPETGQTTRITVMRSDRSVVTTHDGLTGVSFELPASSFAGEASGIVRLTAVRDGLESLQGHEVTVTLTPSGYGSDYGSFYGGAGGEYDPGGQETPPPPPDPVPEDPWTQPPVSGGGGQPWVPQMPE